ncbi:MAG: PorP/SprF family type IX secretion system membrane protein [Bacteroidetes bacterium]|nr:PorP/SprF family type IX secretion system membrane protein [Bacteroidota bacterium]
MKKNNLLLIIFIYTSKFLLAQDPEFSQFYANPLYLNPALTGTSQKLENAAGRATLNYRNQWQGSYRTWCAGWDQGFDKVHGGFGAQIVHDAMADGLIQSSEIRGFYSYHMNLGKEENQLYAGLQLSYGNRFIDFSRLKFGSQVVPGVGFIDSGMAGGMSDAISYPNAAFGLVFSNTKITFGAAIHNLLEPNISFYQSPNEVIPKRYTVHFGYHFQEEGWGLSAKPQLLFMQQRNFSQAVIGSSFNFKNIQAGLWYRQTFGQYRNADAVIFSAGYMSDHIQFLYSYDMTVSDGRSAIPSSHELSLAYRWKTKQKRHSTGKMFF